VRGGLSRADALKALTVNPAAMLGLKGLGEIAPGFDADLVLYSGDPFSVRSHVIQTLVAGETVYACEG
jgi:imidazolonepropionase-like amidohydrolase